jgi:hypothetical protein
MLSVNVTVPSNSNGRIIPKPIRKKVLLQTIAQMSQLFGGATATNGIGGWVSQEDGKLVTEDVTVVQSFTDDETASEKWTEVERIAKDIKMLLQQESVLISTTPVQQVAFI